MPDTQVVVTQMDKAIAAGFDVMRKRGRVWRVIALLFGVALSVAVVALVVDHAHDAAQVTSLSKATARLAQIDHRTQSGAVALRQTVRRLAGTNAELGKQIAADNLFADQFRLLIVYSVEHNKAGVARVERRLKHASFIVKAKS